MYHQNYILGNRIALDIIAERDLFELADMLENFIADNRLKGITFYYLLTPFKLAHDLFNKLVIKGKSLDKISEFLVSYNKTVEIAKPARHQLSVPSYGGEDLLEGIESLLKEICRLALKKRFANVDKLVFGVNFILSLGKASSMDKKDLKAFCGYLFNAWVSIAYDTQLTPYTALIQAKERTVQNFERLRKENKNISRFIQKSTADHKLAKLGWQKELFIGLKRFTRHKHFNLPTLLIPSFELKKALQYTDDPQSGKRWFIYRKVTELVFLNAGINEKDFSFIAFLIKETD
jgi:hypothetical protein